MQLRLNRSQEYQKDTVVFVLTATALLTKSEADLINRYKLVTEVLATGEISLGMVSKTQLPFQVRVGHLLHGYTQRFEDLGSMLEFENQVKASCQRLIQYIDAARTFGGAETFEVRLPTPDRSE